MNNIARVAVAAFVVSALCVLQGCEWEDSGSFNTSRGAGVNVNFSGFYRPKSGDYIAGSNVTYLVLTQTGNALEAYDNNNNYYSGSVGAPGIMGKPGSSGAYSSGANLLQAQISFSGVNSDRKTVQFVGVVRAVAAASISATVQSTVGQSDIYSNSQFNVNQPPISFGDITQYQGQNNGGTIYTYALNEGNTWYLMEGTWIEGGVAMSASAKAPAVNGDFTLDPSVSININDITVQSDNSGQTDVTVPALQDLTTTTTTTP